MRPVETPVVIEPPAVPLGSSSPAKKDTPISLAVPPRPVPLGPPPPDYGERFLCDIPERSTPVVIKTKDGEC